MKRVITEYGLTPPGTARIFQMPPDVYTVMFDGKVYADYLVSNDGQIPADPYYVGEMLEDGSVVAYVGDASTFPHNFAGWDRTPATFDPLQTLIITPRQARLALLQTGLLQAVEDIVATQPLSVRIQWDYAIDIRRYDPLVCSLLAALGQTEEQINSLFELAITF
jgi:hypothetical protein